MVIRNGDNLQIVEQRQEDDVESLEAEVVEDGKGGQEEHDLHGDADAVDHVRLQPAPGECDKGTGMAREWEMHGSRLSLTTLPNVPLGYRAEVSRDLHLLKMRREIWMAV